MDEELKNRVLLFSIILAIISLILAFSSGLNARRNKLNLQKERLLRMETEEKLQGLSGIEEKLKSLETKLQEEIEAHEETQGKLNQEILTNQALKNELEKTTKLKERLEEDLKEALISKPSRRTR